MYKNRIRFSPDRKREKNQPNKTNPGILLDFSSHLFHNHIHNPAESNHLALKSLSHQITMLQFSMYETGRIIFLCPNCVFTVGRKEVLRILVFFTSAPLLFPCRETGNSVIASDSSNITHETRGSWKEFARYSKPESICFSPSAGLQY